MNDPVQRMLQPIEMQNASGRQQSAAAPMLAKVSPEPWRGTVHPLP
jgi:hypothetical protein